MKTMYPEAVRKVNQDFKTRVTVSEDNPLALRGIRPWRKCLRDGCKNEVNPSNWVRSPFCGKGCEDACVKKLTRAFNRQPRLWQKRQGSLSDFVKTQVRNKASLLGLLQPNIVAKST